MQTRGTASSTLFNAVTGEAVSVQFNRLLLRLLPCRGGISCQLFEIDIAQIEEVLSVCERL